MFPTLGRTSTGSCFPVTIQDPIEGEVVDPPAPDDIDQTPPEDKPASKKEEPKAEEPVEKSTETIGGMRRNKLFAVLKDRGFTGDAAKQVIYSTVGVESVNDILVADFDEIIKMLKDASDEDLKAASEVE